MGYQYYPMISQVCTLPFHIAWCFLLVDYYEMGIRGTALASSITSFVGFISLSIYTSRFTE